jgi:hypothetical protein
MAATQYLPTSEVVKVKNFVQFSSTVSAFNTALQGAFATASVVIQVQADPNTGKTSNAQVIINDSQQVISVAPNNWLGFNSGVWEQYTPAQMNGDINSLFTPYFTS